MVDFLVVGAGLYGAVMARQLKDAGKRVLIIEKRNHIAGNIYTKSISGINTHVYGAHIFHTNNAEVWSYICRFADFNRFTNSPVANYCGELYSLPFSMYTFNRLWGITKPEDAKRIINEQRAEIRKEPTNLEEQAISLVGRDIYEKLIKGYTEKQWGRECKDLPAFIIKRLPVRFTYDNNYFNARFQGIPIGGYTNLVQNMLDGIEVKTNVDYLQERNYWDRQAKTVVFTGAIDEYYDYVYGPLEYRSVRFETETLEITNYQGNAVMNYTDSSTPYTRIIEHKWFEFGKDQNGKDIPLTVISREFSKEWEVGDERFYPINDKKNTDIYKRYKDLAKEDTKHFFGGRLGEYKYYDMDQVIEKALQAADLLV